MELKQLIADEDAVSPVIGVILMVAITVILAAVIGTFVLGLGEQVQSTTPSVSFSFDYTTGGSAPAEACTNYGGNSGDWLEVTHDGGDQVTASQMTIRDSDGDASNEWQNCDNGVLSDSDVAAGDTASADSVESDDTIRVVWTAAGGGNSGTIGRWTGPDA